MAPANLEIHAVNQAPCLPEKYLLSLMLQSPTDLARAARRSGQLSVPLLNIGWFKPVNAAHGRQGSDTVNQLCAMLRIASMRRERERVKSTCELCRGGKISVECST